MGKMAAVQLVEAFIHWMNAGAMSRATMRRRASSLRGFATAIAPITLDTATYTDVEDWLSTKRAPRTRHAYRSDLSAFYQWGVRRRLLAHNPMLEVAHIRVPKGLPKPIPAKELHVAIHYAEPRVRLALMLAGYAGLRCAEIAALTTAEVSAEYVVVRGGKGGKDRAVPLHPTLAVELGSHRLASGERYITVTPDRLSRLTADHLRGLGIDATLHCARHSFGTELWRTTHDPVLVSQLMGHEKMDTSMNYVKLSPPGRDSVALMWGAA